VKIRPMWIFDLLMSIVITIVFCFATYVIIQIHQMTILWKIVTGGITFLIAIWGFWMGLDSFNNSRAYYVVRDMPAKDFSEINLYTNSIVLVHENYSWRYTYGQDKIAKLKYIIIICYYNRKKKFLGWIPAPYYEPLDKQLRKQHESK